MAALMTSSQALRTTAARHPAEGWMPGGGAGQGRGLGERAWVVRRPLFIIPVLWARPATALSWLTMIRVRLSSSHSASRSVMISSLVSSSRLPVGSSASETLAP